MSDDHIIAAAVSECREIMRDMPTRAKLTACYNLTLGVFRLFCVCGEKKDLELLADEFARGMKEEIMEKNDPT